MFRDDAKMTRKVDMTHENWIKYYVTEKRSMQEIAELCGMSKNWVKKRLIDHKLIDNKERIGNNNYKEIVEVYYRRRLTKEEEIHHINFNHTDNRIENLFIINSKEHITATRSASCLLTELIDKNIIVFDKEKKVYYYKGGDLT